MNHNPEDMALLDTNILIYADQEQDSHHHVAKMLRDRGQHPVTGQDIHDLHLAATMISNGIKKIYTFNAKDFEPIPGIEVLDPEAIDFIEYQEYDEDLEQEHQEESEDVN